MHECINEHQWKIAPDNLLRGKGCPYCSKHGLQLDQEALVYFIKIGEYYKIGVTNSSVYKRFYRDREKEITVFKEEHYSTGKEAFDREQELLQLYKDKRVHIPGYLKSEGNSELFRECPWL